MSTQRLSVKLYSNVLLVRDQIKMNLLKPVVGSPWSFASSKVKPKDLLVFSLSHEKHSLSTAHFGKQNTVLQTHLISKLSESLTHRDLLLCTESKTPCMAKLVECCLFHLSLKIFLFISSQSILMYCSVKSVNTLCST